MWVSGEKDEVRIRIRIRVRIRVRIGILELSSIPTVGNKVIQ